MARRLFASLILTGTIATSLSGCSHLPFGASPSPSSQESAQETAMNVETLTLEAASNGQTLTTATGSTLTIKLESIPTAGYLWLPRQVPDFLEEINPDAPIITATNPELQSQPGFTGGNHFVSRTYKVTAAGQGDLILVEARPWELESAQASGNPEAFISETFKLHITAIAAGDTPE